MENLNENNPQAGTSGVTPVIKPESKRIVAGICALLVGSLGIHKFVLGYTNEGIIMLVLSLVALPVVSFFTCGFGGILYIPMWVIPIIEGIMYLTKTDDEFVETYQVGTKKWF